MKLLSGVGIFKRMGGIGVEESAAVGSEHLDGDLGGDGALGDRFAESAAKPSRRIDRRIDGRVRIEILNHPLADEKQRVNDADRKQQIEMKPDQIAPEIADGSDADCGRFRE